MPGCLLKACESRDVASTTTMTSYTPWLHNAVVQYGVEVIGMYVRSSTFIMLCSQHQAACSMISRSVMMTFIHV